MTGKSKGSRLALNTKRESGTSHTMVGRTVSVDSTHTESSSDSSLANSASEYNRVGGTSNIGQSSSSAGGSGMSGKRRYELRASCPESLLLQHNHVLSRLRGYKMHPPRSSDGQNITYYQPSCDKKVNRQSSMSIDSNESVLEDARRFIQENYHCSFCPTEKSTFEKLIKHIEVEHPWYDLRIHRKIR